MSRIHVAEKPAEREAVYRLRYEIYVEQQRLLADEANHERRWLHDASDEHATLLYAEVDGDVVGSLRICSGAAAPFDDETRDAYDIARFEDTIGIEHMWILSRFLVREEHRGGVLPFAFVREAAKRSVEAGVELAFCDCEPHLLNLYTKIGFRTYRTVFNHASTGIAVPLVMIPGDLDHLRHIGSPLLSALEKRTRPSDVGKALAGLLRDTPPVIGQQFSDRDAYESIVVGFLDERPELPPLFDGLAPDEIDTVLRRSHVIDLGRGDHLIRRGQTSRTLYLVLEGSLEVWEDGRLVGVATRGESLGEVAFLLGGERMSDVTAVTDDVRVLALNEKGLQLLIETDSTIAARFLLYLSKCLCLKLRERSHGAGVRDGAA